MRERIRLTPEERHQLDLIEQRLRSEDPAFVRRLGFRPSRRRRLGLACAAMMRSSRVVPTVALAALVIGAVLMVVGLPNVPLAVVGYLTMLAGALVLTVRGPRVVPAFVRRVRSVATDRRRPSS